MDILKVIKRSFGLFDLDIEVHRQQLEEVVSKSRFLVIGGAGSIGQSVVKEIFKRNPKKLHVIDINENNLVELVRDLRSSFGYIDGDFSTYTLDVASCQYEAFIQADGCYDYVLNLSALKHVRSEKDPFTLMRMIEVNILNTIKTINQSINGGVGKYFAVSSDKAANPVSMMGASKRIMEMFLMRESNRINISTARFANVAFSDGSLLHGFNQRLQKQQPIVAPNDVLRYFVTPGEAGELCLLSCIYGENRDIFFPKLTEEFNLMGFDEIAIRYLSELGYEPYICSTEEEARQLAKTGVGLKKWPCYFSASDTTGEKEFEEFYTNSEIVDWKSFNGIGIVKNGFNFQEDKLDYFVKKIYELQSMGRWKKADLLQLFFEILPSFAHQEKGKYLEEKM